MEEEKILAAVFEAIDEVNAVLPPEGQIVKDRATVLFGEGGTLDSLGLVKMIVAVEGKLQEHFGTVVTLANERAMAREENPFRSVGSLAEYAAEVLKEEARA